MSWSWSIWTVGIVTAAMLLGGVIGFGAGYDIAPACG
jgi:hypothetical protein